MLGKVPESNCQDMKFLSGVPMGTTSLIYKFHEPSHKLKISEDYYHITHPFEKMMDYMSHICAG